MWKENNMEREQIIKALECCANNYGCKECPLYDRSEFGGTEKCMSKLIRFSLALINEFIEDNKEKDKTISKLVEIVDGIQAGTVLKIGFDDVVRLIYGETEYFIIGNPFIDLIKKAMLEENENGQREND